MCLRSLRLWSKFNSFAAVGRKTLNKLSNTFGCLGAIMKQMQIEGGWIYCKLHLSQQLLPTTRRLVSWQTYLSARQCQGFIQTFVSGGVCNSQGGRSSGRRPRVEARSAEWGRGLGRGVPLPVWGSGGVTPGKILKLEARFGAISCILATNWYVRYALC